MILAARLLAAVAILLLVATDGFAGDRRDEIAPPKRTKTNVVVILTDDQRWDTVVHATREIPPVRELMPVLERELLNRGTTFLNAFATTPQCCPFRASVLSGGFLPKDAGVLGNEPPNGGSSAFEVNDGETLPVLLQRAGYATAMIGKYLNGYLSESAPRVPPGWDDFFVFRHSRWFRVRGIEGTSRDQPATGHAVRRGEGYIIAAEGQAALDFIGANASRPFFLWLALHAPHEPAEPETEEDLRIFRSFRFRGRAYGASHRKSDRIRALAELYDRFEKDRPEQEAFARRQLACLRGIDRVIDRLIGDLRRRKLLDSTVIVFASDNGYQWGEHGLFRKGLPYEESIRVPLAIAAPAAWGSRRPTDDHLVAANLDLAATIRDIAGIHSGESQGMSLLPLLTTDSKAWQRDAIVFQEFDSARRSWSAIRTSRWKYVEWGSTGERELYDVASDPYETRNLAREPRLATEIASLRPRLELDRGLGVVERNLPSASLGKAFHHELRAWGGRQPYRWTVQEGPMPPGLALDPSGVIAGTPTRAGSFELSVGVQAASTRRFTHRPETFVARIVIQVKGK
ncbi:MAG: hypothetical protein QOD06_1379 [Candidatus Binatota bacterium]|nr:hypothetical protein [Candidatus Binatota bacterium]